jgi:hypothetical protein
MKRGSGRNLGPFAPCILLFEEKLVSHIHQQSLPEKQHANIKNHDAAAFPPPN